MRVAIWRQKVAIIWIEGPKTGSGAVRLAALVGALAFVSVLA
jgi:hypothetical protein